ncbi:MAG: GntR family transcriptional regulator [Gordonia sp. (in: high G+C Gram-positive bacteria)]
MDGPLHDDADQQDRSGELVARIYERLRERLLRRSPDDELLLETEIARDFGVSRTPVREALALLQHDGILERARRGYRLRRFDPQTLINLYETRVALEVALAGHAAERRTDLELARLEHLHEWSQRTNSPQELDRVRTLFHQALWAGAHNEDAVSVLEQIFFQIRVIDHQEARVPQETGIALEEHAALVEAIRARDGAAARRVAEQHLLSTRARLLVQLAAYQEGAGGPLDIPT